MKRTLLDYISFSLLRDFIKKSQQGLWLRGDGNGPLYMLGLSRKNSLCGSLYLFILESAVQIRKMTCSEPSRLGTKQNGCAGHVGKLKWLCHP